MQKYDLRNMTILGMAKEIIRVDGPSGLWRGTTATILRNVPGVALYFTSLNKIRTMMAQSPHFSTIRQSQANSHGSTLPKLTSQGNLLAGAIARSSVGFILNPFTLLKARYESNLHSYGSLSSAFMSLVRSGPSEMFRGFVPSALRDAPYAGIFVVFYEGIKQEASRFVSPQSALASSGLHSFSAAASGAIATLVTHPFDVVKASMQVRTEKKFRSLFQTVSAVWQQRGILGFFDGATLRMSRKVLSSVIGWTVYESMLIFIRTNGSKM
ncbi:mitochondrial carrier [Panus rudis PR-1116 ss-1]|nr:mitochondrial carrier [Panus rudis PR-1116 ss-1]